MQKVEHDVSDSLSYSRGVELETGTTMNMWEYSMAQLPYGRTVLAARMVPREKVKVSAG